MNSRISLAFTAVLLPVLILTFAAHAGADSKQAVAISDGPQLFLDDYLVARQTNLASRLQQPTKHAANPLIIQEHPWEKQVIEIYGTVLYEPESEKFRCWYLAGEYNNRNEIPDTPEHPRTALFYTCYAESKDGIYWTKPMVGEGKFGRHSKHNVVVPRSHGFSVLPTPDDPNKQRRYKGLGGDVEGFSPDGIHWDLQPFLAAGKNDTSSSFIWWKGEYLAFVRNQGHWSGGVLREVGISVSKDFHNWSSKKTVFKTDKRDDAPWTQAYGLAVTPYGDQLIGIVWMIHLDRERQNNMRGFQDMQLLVSRDGRKWDRVADRAVFMAPTPDTWDVGRVFPGSTMFVKDDLVHIYYTGTNTRHGSGSWGRPGIGLATLPADRFVALSPEDDSQAGLLETKPFSFQGKELLVNAEVAKGDLRVELLDAKGNVLPGFGREHCQLVKHDPLRYRVAWGPAGNTKSIGDSSRKTAALRFHLKHGDLYAFQILK